MLHYHYLVGIDLLTPLSSSLFSTIHYLYKINPIFRLLRTYQTGCSDGAPGDDFADTQYAPRGALVSAVNVQTGFFDQLNPSASNIAFDLESKGETPSAVDVLVSYEGGGEAVFTSVSSIPSNVAVSFSDVLNLLGVSPANVNVGDNVVFAFDATTSSGKYRSSSTLSVPVSCFSDLGGTYDFVGSNLSAITGTCPGGEVTGTVIFTDMGGGTYLCSDLGFGQYPSTCWNDTPATSGNATFKDVCNEIISGGLDQYGLTYIWVVTDVSGPDLSLSWTNDYDDSGDAVITRTDGSSWPALFSQQ